MKINSRHAENLSTLDYDRAVELKDVPLTYNFVYSI
jgi:hypothetical protein